jgi:hypothetical protein
MPTRRSSTGRDPRRCLVGGRQPTSDADLAPWASSHATSSVGSSPSCSLRRAVSRGVSPSHVAPQLRSAPWPSRSSAAPGWAPWQAAQNACVISSAVGAGSPREVPLDLGREPEGGGVPERRARPVLDQPPCRLPLPERGGVGQGRAAADDGPGLKGRRRSARHRRWSSCAPPIPVVVAPKRRTPGGRTAPAFDDRRPRLAGRLHPAIRPAAPAWHDG